jgi:hypothetical protein
MADSSDAQRLRESWTVERLGSYEGKWIAFQYGEVRGNHFSLRELSSRFAQEISEGKGPLFAFVTFQVLQ